MLIALLLERALHLGELFLQEVALHHLHCELVIETFSKSNTNHVRTPTVNPRQKADKANQGLINYLLLEFARLLALLDRLGLQGLNPCSVLIDLHNEPGGHILGLGL
jgi:hypothetical protein